MNILTVETQLQGPQNVKDQTILRVVLQAV